MSSRAKKILSMVSSDHRDPPKSLLGQSSTSAVDDVPTNVPLSSPSQYRHFSSPSEEVPPDNRESPKPLHDQPGTSAVDDVPTNVPSSSRSRHFLSPSEEVPPDHRESPKPLHDQPETPAVDEVLTNVLATSRSRYRRFSSSSEESEPFQDSGESYVPSDNEQDDDSDDGLSTQNSEDEDNEVEPNENIEVAENRWGECRDIPARFNFSDYGGLKVHTLDLSDPYAIFRHFVSDQVLDIIVVETNRYATQYIQSHHIRPRSMLRKWKDTSREEMKQFLGILMIMGVHHLPKMRLYWSNNDMYGNMLIKKTMRRDRFDCILKFFHLSNNEDPLANTDRLYKVRNIINLICSQFKQTLCPGDSVVIDESMVPWRGRLVFRQYLPAKSHKYGVKLYKICTPDGFTYDLRIYAGKNIPDLPNNEHGHTYNVCMDLLRDLLNKGRTLYIDNYYTSVQLSKTLLESKTYVCGTLRQNRKGNPRAVCGKKLKKGEIYGEQNQIGIRVVKWVDKRAVLMISTVPEHTAELKATGGQNRKGEDIFKPPAVIDYNKAKKGVDMSDQMSAYYTCLRKTVKWYKKVFFEILLGTCVVNSWVLYNDFGENRKKMDILQLREKIARGLLKIENENENIEAENPELPNPQPVRKRPRNNTAKTHHKLEKYEGTVRQSRKRCVSCYQKIQNTSGVKEARNKSKRVSTFCRDCPNQPTMCLPCFNETHK